MFLSLHFAIRRPCWCPRERSSLISSIIFHNCSIIEFYKRTWMVLIWISMMQKLLFKIREMFSFSWHFTWDCEKSMNFREWLSSVKNLNPIHPHRKSHLALSKACNYKNKFCLRKRSWVHVFMITCHVRVRPLPFFSSEKIQNRKLHTQNVPSEMEEVKRFSFRDICETWFDTTANETLKNVKKI